MYPYLYATTTQRSCVIISLRGRDVSIRRRRPAFRVNVCTRTGKKMYGFVGEKNGDTNRKKYIIIKINPPSDGIEKERRKAEQKVVGRAIVTSLSAPIAIAIAPGSHLHFYYNSIGFILLYFNLPVVNA